MFGATIGRTASSCPRTHGRVGVRSKVKVKSPSPAVAATCTPYLSLPVLSKSVPREYVIDSPSRAVGNIALQLLDLGLVTEDDAALSPLEIIKQALSRWCRNRTSSLRHFHPSIVVSDTFEGGGVWGTDEEGLLANENIAPNAELVVLGIYYRESHSFTLSEKCSPLHAIEPKFMQYAVNALYRTLDTLMFAVTPELPYQTAEHFYWDWQDETGEEMEITREAFHSVIPEWVANPGLFHANEFDHCIGHENEAVRQIAQHLATRNRLDTEQERWTVPYSLEGLCEDGVTIMQNGTWIAWDGDELFNRIMDDWGEYNYQGNTTDLNRFFLVAADRQGVGNALRMLEYYFDQLLWADRLLEMLGTKETNNDRNGI